MIVPTVTGDPAVELDLLEAAGIKLGFDEQRWLRVPAWARGALGVLRATRHDVDYEEKLRVMRVLRDDAELRAAFEAASRIGGLMAEARFVAEILARRLP